MSTPAPRKLAWWKAALLSVGGGFLMALAFPPFDISGMVWVGLLPLLTALWLGPASKWRGFQMGLYYGMAYYGTCFHWINGLAGLWGIPLPLFLAVAFLPLVAMYASLIGLWGMFAATVLRPVLRPAPDTSLATPDKKKEAWNDWVLEDLASTLRSCAGLGALWVCIEWVRAFGSFGCSWNSLGTALYDGLSLAQWAEFVGTNALAFLPVATSVILWCAGRRMWMSFHGARKMCRPWDFYGAVVILFMLFMGGLSLSRIYSPAAMMEREGVMKLPVVAIQLNTDQKERIRQTMDPTTSTAASRAAYRDKLTAGCLAATQKAFQDIQRETFELAMKHPGEEVLQQLPVWVVWPESAMGKPIWKDTQAGCYLADRALNEFLSALSSVRDTATSMGGPRFVLLTGADEALLGDSLQPYGLSNSLVCIPDNAADMCSAAKQHLLPFGEYIPFVNDIEWIGKAYSAITGTAAGDGIRPGTGSEPLVVPVPGTHETVKVIPAVCYEETVSPLLRKFARPGAQVIVNDSNDAWFGRSACGIQQARAAAFRCIELRRSMVRAANGGLCCTIAPNGGFISTLTKDGSPHVAGYCYGILPVDRNAGLTVYAMLGDWAVMFCLLIALGFSIPGMKRFRKP